jgi:hypothetical protein
MDNGEYRAPCLATGSSKMKKGEKLSNASNGEKERIILKKERKGKT